MFFFFSSRRRHTRLTCDWSSDVCSSDLGGKTEAAAVVHEHDRGKRPGTVGLGHCGGDLLRSAVGRSRRDGEAGSAREAREEQEGRQQLRQSLTQGSFRSKSVIVAKHLAARRTPSPCPFASKVSMPSNQGTPRP